MESQVQKSKRKKMTIAVIAGGIVAIGIALFLVFAKTEKTVDNSLIPVSSDGEKWGYINHKGEYIINPQFEDADFFSDDFAKIKSNDGKTGYINKKGEYVIPATYKNGTEFNEGLVFVVTEGGLPTCIDKNGNTKFVLDIAKYVSAFSEGLAMFVTENGEYGFVDKTGNIVIKAQFERAMPFSGGFARIWQKDNVGFIDKTGKIVINPQFKAVGNFNEEKAPFSNGKQWGYINTKGAYVINPQFDDAARFGNGIATVKQGRTYGYINSDGKLLINPQFDEASSFSDGLAVVRSGNKYGYINKDGKYAINPQFELSGDFHNGIALVRSVDKWGFINKKGEYVVNPQFQYVKHEVSTYEQPNFIENDYYDTSEFIKLFFEKENGNTFDGVNASTTLAKLSEHPIYGADLNAQNTNFADYSKQIPITNDISIEKIRFQFDNTPIYEYEDTYDGYYGYRTGRTQKWNFNAKPDGIIYQLNLSGKAYEKRDVVISALISEIERRHGKTMESAGIGRYLVQDNGKLGFAVENYSYSGYSGRLGIKIAFNKEWAANQVTQ